MTIAFLKTACISSLVPASLLILGITACVGPVDDVTAAPPDSGDAELSKESEADVSKEYTRTIVRIDDAGNESVEVQKITRREQIKDIAAARAMLDLASDTAPSSAGDENIGSTAQAYSIIGNCATSAFWAWDQ